MVTNTNRKRLEGDLRPPDTRAKPGATSDGAPIRNPMRTPGAMSFVNELMWSVRSGAISYRVGSSLPRSGS
jgi:hypothetical protein